MAEDYVALIKDIWEDDKFKGFNLVVRNPYLAKLVERYTFKNIDHIFVVVKEASELLKVRGVDTRKITIVGNTPLLTLIENIESPPDEITNAMHDRYTAIYTGGIQLGRGIQLVLDAIPEIVKFIPNFLFVVIGDGYATNQLKQLIQEKGLQNYVLWAGWIDHSNLFNYLRKSDIGLTPHYTSDHVNTTIPNKIFDYMGCGLPVVASDSAPMKRIIDEEKCGITFKSGNVQDLADKVVQISKFKLEMGENGKMAIKQKYNWEYDEQRLLNAITNLSLD
jgi:glycosyltransferase involved in cell wall biosynthesis